MLGRDNMGKSMGKSTLGDMEVVALPPYTFLPVLKTTVTQYVQYVQYVRTYSNILRRRVHHLAEAGVLHLAEAGDRHLVEAGVCHLAEAGVRHLAVACTAADARRSIALFETQKRGRASSSSAYCCVCMRKFVGVFSCFYVCLNACCVLKY